MITKDELLEITEFMSKLCDEKSFKNYTFENYTKDTKKIIELLFKYLKDGLEDIGALNKNNMDLIEYSDILYNMLTLLINKIICIIGNDNYYSIPNELIEFKDKNKDEIFNILYSNVKNK